MESKLTMAGSPGYGTIDKTSAFERPPYHPITSIMNPFKDLTGYFIFLLLTSTIGPLLFGYHLAELNAPQDVITCARKSISTSTLVRLASHVGYATPTVGGEDEGLPQCIPMNPTQFGLVSSFFTLGGLIGALSAGPMSAKYGRLKTMLYTNPMFIIGGAVEAIAPNVGIMTLGRFIAGLGAGAAVVVVPIYISEVAPPHEKGFFGAFTQVMINVGILIAQLLGYFLSRGQLWRLILGAGGAIGAIQLVSLILGGQESPKWVADNGMPSRAKRVLRRLRGHEANIDEEVTGWGCESPEDLDDEEETLLSGRDHMRGHSASDSSANGGAEPERTNYESAKKHTKNAASEAKRGTVGTLAVLRHPDYSPAVFAVMMIMVAQQLCGINSIVMYGVSLLSDLLAANSAVLNVAVAALNVIITTACAPLVDVLGRKTCLLGSIAGMGTGSLMLAVGIMRHIPILSAVATIFFVASFGLGLGPIPFILSSELVGAEAVGATQSWALAANWVATFLVAQFFPIVNNAMPKGTVYFIFFGFALGFGTFIAWFVPETKGKANAEEVWGRSKAQDRVD